MGVVVAARHLQLDQTVALKILQPAASALPLAVNRFLREARAVAHIQNEHIVRVSDVGTLDSGVPYMVMEFLKGKDLAKVVRANGPLPIATAVDYVMQACEGVAEAHRLGIVHRDLKPSNLFLTQRSDGSSIIKVLDFGISKITGATAAASPVLTSTSSFVGSPLYMSPEQVRSSKDVDTRTDIWSLGVVLHELLTGTPAFNADSASAVMAMIAADPPARARSVRPEVPDEVEAIILRCLQKDRGHRFATVGELAMALASFGSERGRASAERASKILEFSSDSAPSSITLMSSEPPPLLIGDSSATPVRRPEPRRLRTAVIGVVGAAAVSLIAGLAIRRGAMTRDDKQESPSLTSSSGSSSVQSASEPRAADSLKQGIDEPKPTTVAEPNNELGPAAKGDAGVAMAAALGKDRPTPTSEHASVISNRKAAPRAPTAPVGPTPSAGKPNAAPLSSAIRPESSTSVFDHRTF
jgi:serine/threonine-protein kinase